MEPLIFEFENSNRLVRALSAAMIVASKDKAKPVLASVAVQVIGGRGWVVATDTWSMVLADAGPATSTASSQLGSTPGFLLSTAKEAGLVARLKAMVSWQPARCTVTVTGQSAAFEVGAGDGIDVTLADGQYPNWRALFDAPFASTSASFAAGRLGNIERVQKAQWKGIWQEIPPVTFTPNSWRRPHLIQLPSEHQDVPAIEMLVIPTRATRPERFKFGVSS